MNPRRVIVLTSSVLLVLLGVVLLLTFQLGLALIGMLMMVSGVYSFARTL